MPRTGEDRYQVRFAWLPRRVVDHDLVNLPVTIKATEWIWLRRYLRTFFYSSYRGPWVVAYAGVEYEARPFLDACGYKKGLR